jgi:hypothetical protein
LLAVIVMQTALVFAGLAIYTLGFATIAALAVSGRITTRRASVLVALAAITQVAAFVGPDWSRFLLLHVHNLVPLGVWLLWRRRRFAVSAIVVAMFAACVAMIFAGCFDGLGLARPFPDDAFSLTRITDAVAAGFGGAWRHRFLLFFCFTQAVHYALWMRLIPEEARDRETPRSWRASWTAYKRDAGPTVARLTIIASIAIPLIALIGGVVRTRALYVTASEFHATVEVMLVAVMFSR